MSVEVQIPLRRAVDTMILSIAVPRQPVIHDALARIAVALFERVWLATWRSGDAADCKSVYAGSIPAVASKICRETRSGFAVR